MNELKYFSYNLHFVTFVFEVKDLWNLFIKYNHTTCFNSQQLTLGLDKAIGTIQFHSLKPYQYTRLQYEL